MILRCKQKLLLRLPFRTTPAEKKKIPKGVFFPEKKFLFEKAKIQPGGFLVFLRTWKQASNSTIIKMKNGLNFFLVVLVVGSFAQQTIFNNFGNNTVLLQRGMFETLYFLNNTFPRSIVLLQRNRYLWFLSELQCQVKILPAIMGSQLVSQIKQLVSQT